MSLLSTILINFLILAFRLRIINNIIHIFKHSKKIIARSMFYGSVGALLIYIYPHLLNYLDRQNLLFNNLSFKTVSFFLFYIIGLTFIINGIREKKVIKRISTYILYTIVALVLGYLSHQRRGSRWSIGSGIFFLIVATAEEWFKLTCTQTSFHKYHITHSDIVLFGMLTALWFSFRENILLSFGGESSFIRAPMYIIHVLFTCIATYGLYLVYHKKVNHKKKKSERLSLLGICSAIRLHTLYNFTHFKLHFVWTIILLLWLYYILSYFIYQTESIYLAKQE